MKLRRRAYGRCEREEVNIIEGVKRYKRKGTRVRKGWKCDQGAECEPGAEKRGVNMVEGVANTIKDVKMRNKEDKTRMRRVQTRTGECFAGDQGLEKSFGV